MQCSTATSQHGSRDVAQFGWSHVQPAKLGRAFLVSEAAAHRVAHCVRLLADFLEHVVRVIALLDVFRAELDFLTACWPIAPSIELISNLSRSSATNLKS